MHKHIHKNNIMSCIRTKQIDDYNSNIIHTQCKQHKANTKTHTYTPTHINTNMI